MGLHANVSASRLTGSLVEKQVDVGVNSRASKFEGK